MTNELKDYRKKLINLEKYISQSEIFLVSNYGYPFKKLEFLTWSLHKEHLERGLDLGTPLPTHPQLLFSPLDWIDKHDPIPATHLLIAERWGTHI